MRVEMHNAVLHYTFSSQVTANMTNNKSIFFFFWGGGDRNFRYNINLVVELHLHLGQHDIFRNKNKSSG